MSRRRAFSRPGLWSSYVSTQWHSRGPPPASPAARPIRPRSWCSCERPKSSACSTMQTVAAGTSTPTSMTEVDTSTEACPSAKSWGWVGFVHEDGSSILTWDSN